MNNTTPKSIGNTLKNVPIFFCYSPIWDHLDHYHSFHGKYGMYVLY
jgi:hypothetical protein